VTGANGYLGKAIVHELLKDKGGGQNQKQRIFCLTRPQRVKTETEYWQHFCATTENVDLRVLPYDMLDGGETLLEALKQTSAHVPCCVYHVASKFGPAQNHQQTALDNVQGAEDLVRTLAKYRRDSTSKLMDNNSDNQQDKLPPKLVLTSSMAAVRGTGQAPKNGKFYTFEDWNTSSELGANWGASYQWSKAESERRARQLCQELGIPMVSLCPSFVFGPPHDAKSSTSYSLELVGQWAQGESPVQSRLFVDVRDAAAAHVAAGQNTATDGQRYIVSTEARVASQDIAAWLMEACQETGLCDASAIHYDSEFTGGAIAIGDQEVEATERLKSELGIDLQPVQHTIVDMATALLRSPEKTVR